MSDAVDPTKARIETEWKVGSPIIGCRFDPSGRFLFATANDSSVRRYDMLTGESVSFSGHKSWVRGIAFLSDKPEPEKVREFELRRTAVASAAGNAPTPTDAPPKPKPFQVLTGDYHGQLIWWTGDGTPNTLRQVAAHDGWLRALAVSPDQKLVASCGNDNLAKLWSATTGELVRPLLGHDSHVYNVSFHPDGKRLYSSDLKGTVKEWEVETGKHLRDFDAKILWKYDNTFLADIGGARGMTSTDKPPRIACCGITNVSNAFAGVGNPIVVIFDIESGEGKPYKPKEDHRGTAWGVHFHPAGFVMAAGGGQGGWVWFWTGDDTTASHTLKTPTGSRDLAVTPLGHRFAVGGANGTVYIYTFDS